MLLGRIFTLAYYPCMRTRNRLNLASAAMLTRMCLTDPATGFNQQWQGGFSVSYQVEAVAHTLLLYSCSLSRCSLTVSSLL